MRVDMEEEKADAAYTEDGSWGSIYRVHTGQSKEVVGMNRSLDTDKVHIPIYVIVVEPNGAKRFYPRHFESHMRVTARRK